MICKEWKWKYGGVDYTSLICTTKPNHWRWKLGPFGLSGRLFSVRIGNKSLVFGICAYDVNMDENFTGFRVADLSWMEESNG